MPKSEYSIKVKNGNEYYFYRLRHDNLKKPKDLYAKSIKEMKTKIKDLTYELDHNISNNKEYFGVFFKTWLYDTHLINKKPGTKERYDMMFRHYMENSPIYKIKLKDLTSMDIQSYYKSLNKTKSISVITNLHRLIAPCIRYAYANDRIIKDFSKSIVLPKLSEEAKMNKLKEVNPFTLKEQFNFIKAINGHRLEMLFITALDTGLRKGELFALTWKDIDFKKKQITVNKSFKRVKNIDTEEYENLIQTPKSLKGIRVVPIPDHLVTKLKQHKNNQKICKIKMANLWHDNNLVFCNIYGKYLDSSGTSKELNKILIDNKLKPIKFHGLRHTYATRLFELGENPKTVQKLLGHSNIGITLDTYTHVLENMKADAVSKLNDLYVNNNIL